MKRPPRFPPRFFRDNVFMIFLSVLTVYVDLHAAHLWARDGFELMLFGMCVLSALALLLLWGWSRRTLRVWREWRELLRAFDEHNAAMRERERNK